MQRKNYDAVIGWLLMILFGLPVLSVAVKHLGLPFSQWWFENASIHLLPKNISREMTEILFVPLGAVVVVFVRLTLGLRLMGPFRSILLAIAFRVTGVPIGLAFLAVTVLAIAAIRPAARAMGMGYYARITVMLSAVALLMSVVVLLGGMLSLPAMQRVAYFPIVVLCLIADAFSRTRQKEGAASALWRVAITAGVAVPLAMVADLESFQLFIKQYPELVLTQIGSIVVLSRFMNWKLFEFLNPVLEAEVESKSAEPPREKPVYEKTTAVPIPE